MNKYVYKVRFVTLNFFIQQQKLYINNELIFGKQQQFQQQKKFIAKKYECFMSILTKISFLNFRSLDFTGR